MPNYSENSSKMLGTCDSDLIRLFTEVIKYRDNIITCGHRGKVAQNAAYRDGNSDFEYPDSAHNKTISRAVDAIPYPIDYHDRERLLEFRGFVYGVASQMNIKLKRTIPWDLPHYELTE